MKTRVFIMTSAAVKDYVRVRRLLEAIDCLEGLEDPDSFLGPLYQRTFDAEDPKLEQLRSTLERERIKWSERVEHIYSDSEIRAAPLVDFGIDRKPLDSGGCEYGTTYDLSSACPHCGTGAVQTSPLMVALTELPKKALICDTCLGEVLVAEKLADGLREGDVSGLELRQARLYGNDEPLPWFQMISYHELPRMSQETKGIVRDVHPGFGCTVCERDVFASSGNGPVEIAYDRSEVGPDEIPDVVHTWECFGRSVIADDPVRKLVQGFASPLMLVKPKVYDIFRKLRVKRMRFWPVRFVD